MSTMKYRVQINKFLASKIRLHVWLIYDAMHRNRVPQQNETWWRSAVNVGNQLSSQPAKLNYSKYFFMLRNLILKLTNLLLQNKQRVCYKLRNMIGTSLPPPYHLVVIDSILSFLLSLKKSREKWLGSNYSSQWGSSSWENRVKIDITILLWEWGSSSWQNRVKINITICDS